jgi:hypothetical protein
MKCVLTGCLLAAGAAESMAQNTVLSVVQNLNFKLTGYYQMSMTENSTTFFRHAGKVTINNKDIINLLEQEVNIIFSSDAKLLLISEVPANGETPVDLKPKVVVRDKFEGESFDTDVTRYFSAEILASVEETKINKNPLKASGTSYDVIVFELKLPEVQFKIQGFGKMKVKTGSYEHEPAALVHTGKVDATGNGNYRVSIIIPVQPVALTGTVELSGSDVKAMPE